MEPNKTEMRPFITKIPQRILQKSIPNICILIKYSPSL
jgi:hypothetical protein